MVILILVGVLAGAFFSSTFVINELMSIQGGHWLWSASLRYAFMIVFLAAAMLVSGGVSQLVGVVRLFCSNWRFWVVAGTIGFGAFYALICFAADHSPGWVIAATWQFTIVASLIVLMFFGRSFPKRVWLFSLMIFSGVVMVNVTDFTAIDLRRLLMGALPVLLASFCYPLGNQLVWEAVHGHSSRIPRLDSPLLGNPLSRVLLMSLGSVPLWVVLLILYHPAQPAMGQVVNTALVALFSGLIATSVFLYARNRAKNAAELAGVDATQASEVIFAIVGGLVLLDSPPPTLMAIGGIAIIILGLVMFLASPRQQG